MSVHSSHVLPADDRRFLEENSELMLKPANLGDNEEVVPYWDPKLKHNRKAYNGLAQRLAEIGHFTFTTRPACEVGVFFVWKSSRTKLRMITDARKANKMFREPPGVTLMTGEGIGRIEIEVDGDVWASHDAMEAVTTFVGLSDVKDCFHRMRVPKWLSRYFAWSAVPAKIVNLQGTWLDGKLLGPLDPVFPCAGSLCQGFSWSLYFAQRANEHVCCSVSCLDGAVLASDRGGPVVIHVGKKSEPVPHLYVYVDNLGVINVDKQQVEKTMLQLQEHFDKLGLLLHASEVSSGVVEALGCILEGDMLRSRMHPKRLWKVHHGIVGLLKRKRCVGRTLEVVIGHCTFCGLMNRRSLACFHTVYAFIHRHYYEVATLWPSVVEELEAFKGCLFLMVQDWWRPWNRMVSSSDASLKGYGISQAWWPKSVVAETGRLQERSRFRRSSTHSARESALTAAGFSYDGQTWGRISESAAKRLSEAGWEINPSFQEVPSFGLRREFWSPKQWGRWLFSEAIGILEARAVLKSMKRLSLTRFGHDIRHLHLCDNLGLVLSVERSRSKNFKLLRVLRELSAYCLARNIFLGIRWIPSELNISDEPSRIYDPDDSKLLVDFIGDVGCDLFSQVPPTHNMSPKRVRRLTAPSSHASTAPTQQQQQSSRKRTLTLEGSGQDIQTVKRLRGLEGSSYLQGRLNDVMVEGRVLPRTDQELMSMVVPAVEKKEQEETESASTSSEFQEDRKEGRRRTLQSRQKRRLQNIVNAQLDPESSLLEKAAVSPRVRESYNKRLEEVMTFFDKEKVDFRLDSQVDAALVKLFNIRYQEGNGSYVGDYMLAALMDKYPDFNKTGSRKIPRAWRSLKGWRKLFPSRSRLAYPLAVWCGISWRMVERGHVQKAVFNLLQVSTYSRPGALLKLRRMGLARPTAGVTSCWSMITSLTETTDTSKTGSKDDSILLDSEWLRFLDPILESMSRGPQMG